VAVDAVPPETTAELQFRAGELSILIGEDDPDIADLLVLHLGEEGFDVRVAEDGEAVVESAFGDPPDLIVLDTNMPKLDGPSAALALRARGFAAPILAMSAASQRRDIEFALASGCTEFLRKPAHPDTLKRVVRQLLIKSADRKLPSRN
jgi:DNA-binding response OmpR family regulator